MSEETKKKTTKKPAAKKEAPATAAPATEEVVVVKKAAKKSTDQYQKGKAQYLESGKRKDAVATVVLRPGAGKFVINDKYSLEEYFSNRALHILRIRQPLKIAQYEGQYDVSVNVKGGGKSGQAGAIAHGIARAILLINPEIKKQLKIEGLITRDSRVKETKKYGRKKARKGFTYRKR